MSLSPQLVLEANDVVDRLLTERPDVSPRTIVALAMVEIEARHMHAEAVVREIDDLGQKLYLAALAGEYNFLIDTLTADVRSTVAEARRTANNLALACRNLAAIYVHAGRDRQEKKA